MIPKGLPEGRMLDQILEGGGFRGEGGVRSKAFCAVGTHAEAQVEEKRMSWSGYHTRQGLREGRGGQ